MAEITRIDHVKADQESRAKIARFRNVPDLGPKKQIPQ
jgi:hypothetical protein